MCMGFQIGSLVSVIRVLNKLNYRGHKSIHLLLNVPFTINRYQNQPLSIDPKDSEAGDKSGLNLILPLSADDSTDEACVADIISQQFIAMTERF